MAIVRYIADELTEQEPDGIYYRVQGVGYTYTRLKVTESYYNAKSGVSKLKLELQIKTAFSWDASSGPNYSPIVVKTGEGDDAVTIAPDQWTRKAVTEEISWQTAWETEVELDPRSRGDASEIIEITSDRSLSKDCAQFNYKGYTWRALKVGTYTMPLSDGASGSVIYIGGEEYSCVIGNGTEWESYEVRIGNGTEWEEY